MTATQGRPLRLGLGMVTAAGLAVDAYIHLKIAANYDPITSGTISEGTLFRIEGVVAILAAVAVLVRPGRATGLVAFGVAAAGLAALLVTRYFNIDQIGPFPPMYEPIWYADKTIAVIAQAVAAVSALALIVVSPRHRQLPVSEAAPSPAKADH